MRDLSTWFTSFGTLTLRRSGDVADGEYTHHGGKVDGTFDGAFLRGTWRQGDGKRGPFEMEFEDGGNTFVGHWKYEGEIEWHDAWNGVCLEPPTPGDGRSLGGWNCHQRGPLLAGPMVGEAGQHDARVWAQARDEAPLELVVQASTGPELRVRAEPSRAEWLCVTFVVTGLEPGRRYVYWIESTHGKTERGELRTAPQESARRAVVAFGSCYDAHRGPQPIFDSIGREKADCMLMIGDNCYYMEPDWQSQQTMMLGQLRNRNNESFRALARDLPVLAIWDDHDFGPNDSDGRFENKEAALAVFKRVWAQRDYGLPDVPGIFSTVRWGPVEMFLLDGRWERLQGERILGARQFEWLEDKLRSSTAAVKIIVSGSQLLPLAAVEKDWECFRRDGLRDLERLLGFVDSNDVRGVVYISGDVHLGYVLHERGRVREGGAIGPDVWELTASPLTNEPWDETILSPGQPFDPYIVEEFATYNYGLVDVDLDRSGHEIHFILKDRSGGVLVDQPIALADLAVGLAAERKLVSKATAPKGVTVEGWPGERLTAVLLRGRVAQFLRGNACVTVDLDAPGTAPLSPSSAHVAYPGTMPHGLDTAVAWTNGKAYFFTGARYWRFDLAASRVDRGFPLRIEDHWPGNFPARIEAAMVWDAKTAFFFRGSEYVKWDIEADRAAPGYPKPIAVGWRGVWPEGVDAALGPIDGKVWFFRGLECACFDIDKDRIEDGYPRPILESWPMLELLLG